jgi:SulP family sulfate permease
VKRGFRIQSLAEGLDRLGLFAPLALGLMLFNGLNPPGIFFATGLLLLFSALTYGVSVPVAPMRIIAAYAIATVVPTDRVLAAGMLAAVALIAIGAAGLFDKVRRWIHPSVIRGAEAAVGILLIPRALDLIAGTTVVQTLCHSAEPHLRMQFLGGIPLGVLVGVLGVAAILLLLKSRRWPAGPVVLAVGLVLGLILGTHDGLEKLRPGLHWPRWLPYGIPAAADFGLALVMLTLPQVPDTLDETARLLHQGGKQPRRMTPARLCIAAGLANLVSFSVGGPPLGYGDRLCAERRWPGVALGLAFTALALTFGFHLLTLIHLIPLAIVGALLLVAGARMVLALADLGDFKEALAAAVVCAVTWGWNLALGVAGGLLLTWLLRLGRSKG